MQSDEGHVGEAARERWEEAPIRWLCVLAGACAFVTFLLVLRGWIADDAFITLRYAENIAGGYGPTFNPDTAPPIEGYTTPLWVLLMACADLAGLPAVATCRALGVLFTVTFAVLAVRLAARLLPRARSGHTGGASLLVGAMLACFAPTAIHAVSGMETALFTLAMVAFQSLSVAFVERTTARRAGALAAAALAVSMTRHEGVLVALVGSFVTLAVVERGARLPIAKALSAVLVAPLLAYGVWRYSYYGLPFPLPFYMKVSSGSGLEGLGKVVKFVTVLGPTVGLLVLAGAPRWPRKLAPAVISTGVFIAFFTKPNHIMGYTHRYLYPAVPLLFVLAVVAYSDLEARLSACSQPRMRALGRAFAACVPLLLFGHMMLAAGPSISTRMDYKRGLANAHIALGRFLGEKPTIVGAARPVIAIGDAGAVPYYSGWQTVDLFGLNDAVIALRHGRYDAGYVLSRDPTVIVLLSRRFDRYAAWSVDESRLRDAALLAGYAHVKTLFVSDIGYNLYVMAKTSSPVFDRLQRWDWRSTRI